jgi:hypothetical protein
MRAEIPELPEYPWQTMQDEIPSTLTIMDIIEFCWRAVGKPIQGGYHSFFGHHHLSFQVDEGRAEFRDAINLILRRNGLAYQLNGEGMIERLAPPVLRESLSGVTFQTGDVLLDEMLETARRKFLDPDSAVRREALEKLWDAWERLKTVEAGVDKKAQVTALLDRTAGKEDTKFRAVLETEAKALTEIGNSLQIRHSETHQGPVAKRDHIDYLFHRLFAFILMLLRATGRS